MVGSVKGAPGVSTTSLLLGMAWPRPCVVVEADCSGGSLAIELGVSCDPGLVTLAAARRPIDRSLLEEHSVQVSELCRLVCAPGAGELAAKTVGLTAARLAGCADDVDVIVDAGRLAPESPIDPVLARAHQVLVLARPSLAESQAVVFRTADLRGLGGAVGLVLVGEEPCRPEEVAEAAGMLLAGVLPDELLSARALCSVAGRPRRRWLGLWRAVSSLADTVAASLTHAPGPGGVAVPAVVEGARR